MYACLIGIAVGIFGLPIALTILIWLCGFTCSGIRAGSGAAGCMSCEARSHGGGVESGGCVASLQSMGTCKVTRGCCAVWIVCMLLGGSAGGGIAAAMFCLGSESGDSTVIGNNTLLCLDGENVNSTLIGNNSLLCNGWVDGNFTLTGY